MDRNQPLILLAAGGTGGHLFPAEALGVELIRRGLRVRLATDARALRYSGLFTSENIDVVPSETVRGRSLMSLLRTGYMLGYGTLVAAKLIRRLKPAAVVGFGGYPTVPPLFAARLLGVPAIIHDANAVLGRANRFLSRRVNAIATSLPGVLDRDPALAFRRRRRCEDEDVAALRTATEALHDQRVRRIRFTAAAWRCAVNRRFHR